MTRRSIVILTVAFAAAIFVAGALLYARQDQDKQERAVASASDSLVRPHSPVIGPPDARVTIVEFFDPSCEACRAFYPVVKKILSQFPKEVRLVIRYTPLHQGSDEAVKILETARMQNRFTPVLEAVLRAQPAWASHGAPNLSVAWEAARSAGLDLARARRDMSRPEIEVVLRQDVADARRLDVANADLFCQRPAPADVRREGTLRPRPQRGGEASSGQVGPGRRASSKRLKHPR